jgi:N-acetylglucosamine kinase-like BadF-type ATPase
MKYIIGVDGGGTKTEAIAYYLDGEEIGKGYAGFGNLILGFQDAFENITLSIKRCMDDVRKNENEAECIFIYLGIAGIEAGNIKERLEKALMESFKVEVKATNDADIAMAALLNGEDGILTISGTGSISYGVCNGKKERCGGWGHILGDEGSGYYIALQGFKNMTIEEDFVRPKSELTKLFMERLNIDRISDIKSFVYSANKGEIAAFAPLVIKAADSGDSKAMKILIQAGKDLALITVNLYVRLSFKGQVNVGIKGSILTEIELVRNEFIKVLKSNIECVSIIQDEVSPTKGAYYLAKKYIDKF